MSVLFEPLALRSVQLANRIVVSPMCQYSAEQGFANDWHLVHLGSRAIGGAGLVICEATAVAPEGRISAEDLGLWSDEHIAPLHKITQFIEQQGSVAGVQLGHAGRKASVFPPWLNRTGLRTEAEGGWQPLAPSAIAFSPQHVTPTALNKTAITQVIEQFAAAAHRAYQAGFKVVEIHAAHGYLLHQFLSPLSNQREDEYGGSFENRIRLTCEVVQAVRAVWPEDLPLWVRLSATDWLEGGWSLEDTIALAQCLKPMGVDVLDISSGGTSATAQIPVGPGYQTGFAAQVKSAADMTVGTVGLISEPMQAEHILRTGQADLILLGRELLRDPYWPLRAAEKLGDRAVAWPAQYVRAAHRDTPIR